jgi:outer membrane receptor protein involved in Fe transport
VIASTVTAGTGFTATVALAQEDALEEIVVTGSRLRRDRDFVEVSPVATVGMDEIQGMGFLTMEQTLNRMPQLKADTTSSTNQYGGVAMSADLRGLGATRTLVLVDGRRYIPAENSGIADLASIPDMLVESVEIVTGGASAIYGSDAISGAINFRLRDNFQGAEFRYQQGQAQEGDAQTKRADFLLGAGTDDGSSNVTLAVSWSERGTVMGGDRVFSAIPYLTNSEGIYQPFGSGNIPGTVFALQPVVFDQIKGLSAPGYPGKDLFNSDNSCPGPIQGVRFDEGSLPVPYCRPIDQFNYAATNYLLRPMERYQIAAIAKHEVNDNVEIYAQAFYNHMGAAYQMAPESTSPTSAGQDRGTLILPSAATNPLFNATLRNFWALNAAFFDPDGDGDYAVKSLGRRFEEFGPRHTSFDVDSFLMTSGLRGDFDFGISNWTWDAFFQYSRNDTNQTTTGLLSKSAITLGLDPVVNADGSVTCRTVIRGCVPVNIFGTDAITDEMATFLQSDRITENQFTRKVVGLHLAGDLLEVPAGTVASAFGVEYRGESIEIQPGEAQMRGDLWGAPGEVISGDYSLMEVFGEARVPLIADRLAVEGAVRFADYSTVGQVSTWNINLDMDVNAQLKIRGGYSSAIRAPNLYELLRPISQGFRPVEDPCLAMNSPSQAVKDICVLQGVPSAYINTLEDGTRSGYYSITGGNPDLLEEEATTTTLGFVLAPDMIPGMTMSLDYYSIDLTDTIAQVDGQLLINDCFETLVFTDESCQALVRDPNGNLLEVHASTLNLSDRSVDGMDLSIAYGFDSLPGWAGNKDATLDIQWFSSWQFENSTQVLPTLPTTDCAGFYSGTCSTGAIRPTPAFRSILRASYSTGPLTISPEVNYVGELALHESSRKNENGTQEGLYFINVNGNWDFSEKVGVYFGVNNLFDKEPPIWGYRAAGDLNVNVHVYDPVGRSFFFGVKTAL